MDGFVPTENLRFREESLVFKVAESATEEEVKRMNHYEYPKMSKSMGSFHLLIEKGQFSDSEIIVLLGKHLIIHIINSKNKFIQHRTFFDSGASPI